MSAARTCFAPVTSLIVLMSLLVGCEIPDRRLVEDQRSCEIMGHVRGTPVFRQCLSDLNDRRCGRSPPRIARGGPSNGGIHVVTTECTRLN